MSWYIVASVGGSLIGGLMGKSGASGAAQRQAEMSAAAMKLQYDMFQQQMAATAPWRAAGQGALTQLTAGTQPGGAYAGTFSMADFKNSPTAQFVTKQSLDAMRNQMELGGQNLSTNAITGAGNLASNIAGTYENQAFNEWLANRNANIGALQSLAGLGMQGTSMAVGAMGTAGSNIGGLQVGMGNATAGGIAAGANAMGGAITGGINNAMQMYMMQQLMGNPSGNNSSTMPMPGIDQSSGGIPLQMSTSLSNPPAN